MDDLRLLRIGDVERKVGAKKSAVYDAVREGEFPPPIRLAAKMSVWPSTEVDALIRARIAGKSDAEVRELVRDLVGQRTKALGGAQ